MIVKLTADFCINTERLTWFDLKIVGVNRIEFKWCVGDFLDGVIIEGLGKKDAKEMENWFASVKCELFDKLKSGADFCDLTCVMPIKRRINPAWVVEEILACMSCESHLITVLDAMQNIGCSVELIECLSDCYNKKAKL